MCGKRFGKTRWAIYALLRASFKKVGTYWYVGPTAVQVRQIAWDGNPRTPGIKLMIPKALVRRILENEMKIDLVNGSIIKMIGADHEDALRGPKLDGVVLDEVAYINKYVWNSILRGQLLGSDGDVPGFAYFISSPINPMETIGKNKTDWYPEFYQEAIRKKQAGDVTWDAWHFTIYDNPTLTKEQVDAIREDCTEDEWNVEYMAQPSMHAGTIYSEFKYEQHVMECKASGEMVRGIDWGIEHPTVCLFGWIDNNAKKIYIEDEYVKSDSSIPESCDVIRRMTGDNHVKWTVCDPSLNKRNSVTKIPDLIEFSKNGVPCIPGDNNNRGYSITKMFLKRDMIRIHPKCRTLIKQLKSLQWADKVADDCVDCLRYICVRVHDVEFKWKDEPMKEEKPVFHNRPWNLKDPILFPKGNFEHGSQVMREIMDY